MCIKKGPYLMCTHSREAMSVTYILRNHLKAISVLLK